MVYIFEWLTNIDMSEVDKGITNNWPEPIDASFEELYNVFKACFRGAVVDKETRQRSV